MSKGLKQPSLTSPAALYGVYCNIMDEILLTGDTPERLWGAQEALEAAAWQLSQPALAELVANGALAGTRTAEQERFVRAKAEWYLRRLRLPVPKAIW